MSRITYASEYTPDFGIPWPREDVSKLTEDELMGRANLRKRVEDAAKVDPIQFGWTLESWREVCAEWRNYNKHIILGGNRACVRCDTLIYDPVLGVKRRIDEIKGPHHVYAWDGHKVVVALASEPFTKPAGRMLRVVLRNGVEFVAAEEHRVLLADGSWSCVSELRPGCAIFLPASNSDTCLSAHGVAYVDRIEPAGIEVKWDMTVPSYWNYIVDGVVHHNSKTNFMARLVVDMAMKVPEAKIRCWHVNEEKSIAEQQGLVWAALPKRFKTLGKKRGMNFDINFSQKNGFAGSKLILPPMPGYERGSEIQFNFYQQYRVDSQVAEGWNAHLIWGDEEMPQKLFETLQYRIVDFNGRIMLTFTTLNGWTPLVADICSRKKVLRKRYSSLMKREIPYAEESLSRVGTRIYYFWTEDNPFIPTKTFLKDLSGRPDEEKLARAHGIPTKANFVKFTKFDETVHVIPHEKLPWLAGGDDTEAFSKSFTRYFGCDPAGGDKNWFILWLAIGRNKDVYVYREWPDDSYGSWGEPAENPEGKRGPAQKSLGFTLTDYKNLILEVERGEDVYERYVDPRLANTKQIVKDAAVTIITEMRDLGMELIPAPGVDIEQGEQRIIDLIGYDTTKPIDYQNRPKLYISDKCRNLIDCFKNYTGCSRDEVWKDPIDILRYVLVSGASYVDDSGVVDTGRSFSY